MSETPRRPRLYELAGGITVEWDQGWEVYVVGGAPTHGPIQSLEDLAAALPVPLPDEVRVALAADRAAHPPLVGTLWRRRVRAVEQLLAPLGTAVLQVVPYIAAPQREAVEVTAADTEGAGPTVSALLTGAGYDVQVAAPDVYLVTGDGAGIRR